MIYEPFYDNGYAIAMIKYWIMDHTGWSYAKVNRIAQSFVEKE